MISRAARTRVSRGSSLSNKVARAERSKISCQARSVSSSSARRLSMMSRWSARSLLYFQVWEWISSSWPSVTRWQCSIQSRIRFDSMLPSAAGRAVTSSPAPPTTTTSSSRETKNSASPGSPCRPARPRSWLSSRAVRCREVPITASPPSFTTASWSFSSAPPSLMSVPRPAICVETVTRPMSPASAMIRASSASFFALSTFTSMSYSRRASANASDSATSWVPTSTGWPVSWMALISSMMARFLSRIVAYTRSASSKRCKGSFRSITLTRRS